ncbi:hypothetical protein NDU88_000630 [Pleurodeles waltl]|uniref:Uncharacterized protein n=1 Tax=Pleurodeles waltl TaxID=8319 RepID=A0AAV7VX59_PLEWA|nr:hypothetical protein NDU88_000630 [Pleurodeles waltl]
MPAVSSGSQMVACGTTERTFMRARALRKARKQAPLSLESGGERGTVFYEESTLGGVAKMAAPSGDSEEEGEIEEAEGMGEKGIIQQSEAGISASGSRSLQWVPLVVSPMARRVQEWEVANQSVFRAGEQIEFVDEQGSVLRGTISGVTREDGMAGSAQRFGRPADFRVPVEVRAPPVYRFEERAQSGAVRPTSRETPSQDKETSDPILRITRTIPASRSASSGLVTEEEELDYEDEVPVLDVRAAPAQKAVSSGQAVQGDRLSSRRELAGSLRRGEVSKETSLASGGDSILGLNSKNVDIQVETEDGVTESKPEGLLSSTQVVTVAEIPWAGTRSGCAEDGGSQRVMGIRRVRMLELVQQSIAPSTRRSYEQAWLEFLKSGAVKREGGVEACEIRREDAIHFIMQQIELGLSAVTTSGKLCRGTRWRLFRLDSWALFRAVGGEASGIQAFWNAIGFRWSEN